MSDLAPVRTGWLLPVLLAVTTTSALGLGFLYLARPNTGELGNIHVQVTDEDGKASNSIRVYVAEAPLVQKDAVTPVSYTGNIQYPSPYLVKPNLKLISAKRPYYILTETEFGFTWAASLVPEDFREGAANDGSLLQAILVDSWIAAIGRGNLKAKIVFEEFNWEAKGLRMPASALPPKTFEQTGIFATMFGQESVVFFPIPYDGPPNVELSGPFVGSVVMTDCTTMSFRWKNIGKDKFGTEGAVTWKAKGIRGIEAK